MAVHLFASLTEVQKAVALHKTRFKSAVLLTPSQAQHLVFPDAPHYAECIHAVFGVDDRVHCLALLGAFCCIADGDQDARVATLFSLFDIDGKHLLRRVELVAMLDCLSWGLAMLRGLDPPRQLHAVVDVESVSLESFASLFPRLAALLPLHLTSPAPAPISDAPASATTEAPSPAPASWCPEAFPDDEKITTTVLELDPPHATPTLEEAVGTVQMGEAVQNVTTQNKMVGLDASTMRNAAGSHTPLEGSMCANDVAHEQDLATSSVDEECLSAWTKDGDATVLTACESPALVAGGSSASLDAVPWLDLSAHRSADSAVTRTHSLSSGADPWVVDHIEGRLPGSKLEIRAWSTADSLALEDVPSVHLTGFGDRVDPQLPTNSTASAIAVELVSSPSYLGARVIFWDGSPLGDDSYTSLLPIFAAQGLRLAAWGQGMGFAERSKLSRSWAGLDVADDVVAVFDEASPRIDEAMPAIERPRGVSDRSWRTITALRFTSARHVVCFGGGLDMLELVRFAPSQVQFHVVPAVQNVDGDLCEGTALIDYVGPGSERVHVYNVPVV